MTLRAYIVVALATLSLLFGLATGFAVFYRLPYVLFLLLGASLLWSFLSLWGLRIEVKRPSELLQVGSLLNERIWVRNPRLWTRSWVEVRDESDMPGHTAGMAVSVGGRGLRSWASRTVCRRRGVYRLGPVRVASGDPFGLFRLEQTFGDTQEVVVYPRAEPLPRLQLPLADLEGEVLVRQHTPHVAPQASTVREYMVGDGLSQVHWPSTARLGRLMSKEFDLGVSGRVWLVVDMEQGVHIQDEEEGTDETGVSVAASIAQGYLRQGTAVGLVAYGERPYVVPPALGADQLQRLFGALAQVRTEGTIPLAQVLSQERALFSRHNVLVVITPSLETDWAKGLRRLSQRETAAVVLVDPASFGGAGDVEEAAQRLGLHRVTTYVVRRGQPLAEALGQPQVRSETSRSGTAVRVGDERDSAY